MTEVTLHDVHVAVARVDEKVTTLLRVGEDHEKRVRGLERHRWATYGVGGACAAFVSAGLTYLGIRP